MRRTAPDRQAATGRGEQQTGYNGSDHTNLRPRRTLTCQNSSAFRHPGQPHSFAYALASGEISRIVGRRGSAEAVNCEGWIECEPRCYRGFRLIQRAEKCQGSREQHVTEEMISIGLDTSKQPACCF